MRKAISALIVIILVFIFFNIQAYATMCGGEIFFSKSISFDEVCGHEWSSYSWLQTIMAASILPLSGTVNRGMDWLIARIPIYMLIVLLLYKSIRYQWELIKKKHKRNSDIIKLVCCFLGDVIILPAIVLLLNVVFLPRILESNLQLLRQIAPVLFLPYAFLFLAIEFLSLIPISINYPFVLFSIVRTLKVKHRLFSWKNLFLVVIAYQLIWWIIVGIFGFW